MKNKMKNIIFKMKDEKGGVLVSNFFSLAILQVANFILPLIVIPHLVSVLGFEIYGLLAFATAMVNYFTILSDYGFNLTATREISIHRESKDKLTEIFSSVMIIKFLFLLVGLILLLIITVFIDKFSQDFLLYNLTFGIVLGQVLFPVWFFQGMEKMKYISILNIVAKTIFLIAIFVFVKEKDDFYLVPVFNSLGFIIAGIIALYYIYKKFDVGFKIQKKEVLMVYLKDGWHIFISRIAVVLYTSNNILVLGLLTNNTSVGFYSISEKVISAISALGAMINRVLFPHLSKVWDENKLSYYRQFNSVIKSLIIIMIFILVLLYLASPYIIGFLSGGVKITESISILKILAITVVLFPIGGLFTQSFVTQKKNSLVTKVTLYTSLVNLTLVFVLVYFFDFYGLAITVVCVQLFQTLLNLKYFKFLKKKIVCVE